MATHAGADAASRSSPVLGRTVAALTIAAALGVVAVFVHVDSFPALDGPHHLFFGYLERHFDDAGSAWSEWLTRGHPYAVLGFHLVFANLMRLLPWPVAYRVTLALIGLTWGFGYVALARAIEPRRAAMGLLGFATAIPWVVHMGFFSFAISLGLGFFTLAIALGASPWTMKRRLLLVAMLTAQTVAHAFGAELTWAVLLAIVAYAGDDRPIRARARDLGLLVVMAVPMLLIASTARGATHGTTLWLSLEDHVRVLPRTFLPGPLWRTWPPLLLGFAGVAIVAWRALRGGAPRVERALAAAAALYLVLAFTLPLDLAAWQLFSPRFLPFGVLLGAALVPIERLARRLQIASIAALSVFTGASLAWTARAAAALAADQAEALSGLSAPIHRTGPRLILSVNALAAQAGSEHLEIPFDAPLFHLGPLYAMAQGGIPPYGFLDDNRDLHPFVMSERGREHYPPLIDPAELIHIAEGAQRDPAVRTKFITLLAVAGAPFEDLVLDGRPGDGDLLEARGYAVDFRRGGLFMGHLVPCVVTARITTPAPWPVRMVVAYAPEPMSGAQRAIVLPPVPAGTEHEATRDVPLSPPLCGPMWLRVTPHPDDAPLMTAHGGPTSCDSADTGGRIHIVATHDSGQSVACRIAESRR